MTDDLHSLAAPYVLDALDSDERRRFEQHLLGCPRCTEEVRGLRAAATSLAAAEPDVAPPSALKARVMAEISRTDQEQVGTGDEVGGGAAVAPSVAASSPRTDELAARRARRSWPVLAAAAVVALVLGFGAVLVWPEGGDGGGGGGSQELAAVLEAPDAVTVELSGDVEGALEVVYSEEQGRAVLVGDGLASPGEERTYQLWTISEQGPASAGVFDPGGSEEFDEPVELPASTPDAWAVTIEPDGGSPAPTGDILFQGTTA